MHPEKTPPYQPPREEILTHHVRPSKKSFKVPIILMAWPAISLVFVIVLFVMANTGGSSPDSLFGSDSTLRVIINILSFILGAATILAGPVSFIVGLILFIQRKAGK